MGAYYAGRCYSTYDDANSAHLSSLPITISNAGGYSYFEYYSGSWRYVVIDSNQAQSFYSVPSISYYSCNPADSVIDGVTLAFLVGLVWASSWAITVLRKTFW